MSMILVACSGEPSSGDIKTIVDKEVKPALEMQMKMMSNLGAAFGGGTKSTPSTLDDVKKIGCKADGEKAYKCDIELVFTSEGKKESKVVPMRFIKTSSDWQITN